jgi:uncharacterized repeat protein (TIGR03803 family)
VRDFRPQWIITSCGFILLNLFLFPTFTVGEKVDLSWNPSISSVAGYNVYRSSVSGGPYSKINSSLVAATSYADVNVQPGQTYFYVTTAVNSAGVESAYSNQASAVIPSGSGGKPGSEAVLYSLAGGHDPKLPYAGLVADKAGNLYGTTEFGGANNQGTVFELSPTGDGNWTETVLYSFLGGADGSQPHAGLVLDSTGDLYGTTNFGGNANCAQGCGTIFKLSQGSDGWSESVLYPFTGSSDGREPYARLVFDPQGNLYGTTLLGGKFGTACASGCGTVFRLAPSVNGWKESVLYAFSGESDGALPYAGLTFDASGNLYGTSYAGGTYRSGTVFRLTLTSSGSWTESVLHAFTGGPDGKRPLGALTLDPAGNLYGTTFEGGGTGNYGVVFKLRPQPTGAWLENVLHTFGNRPAANPMAGLVFDTAGNLYGTTALGANLSTCGGGCGTLFKLTPNLSGRMVFSVLRVFGRSGDGYNPSGDLILDSNGNLLGTTQAGGSQQAGTMFEVVP